MIRPVAEFGIYGRKAEAAILPLYGLAKLHNVHVSFVSGNTTMLGIALGQQDWARAGLIAGILRLFVSGAAAGAVIDNLSGLHVLAIGALNVAINRIGGEAISLTYVTSAFVKFGQGPSLALCGRARGRKWTVQAPMWLSLLSGAPRQP